MRHRVALCRRFIHRRYVRAVLTALALPSAVLSILACTVELRHEVSHRAVARFFSRQHLSAADLDRWIRNPRTTRSLEALFASDSAVNSGGLVYADADALDFYPHLTRETLAARADLVENRIIFPRLAAAYHAADAEGFLAQLRTRDVAARLEREGIHPFHQRRLQDKLERSLDRPHRFAALRFVGRVMEHFVPYRGDRYELDFDEALRFYEGASPEGHFVGVFEVRGLQAFAGDDDPWASIWGERSHYVTLSRGLDRCIWLTDHFRGDRDHFRICPIDHPMGRTLFRVERESPPVGLSAVTG